MFTKIKSAFLTVMLVFTLSSASLYAQGADWVDMGPLAGTVQGHVWSKFVDEVGNTVGRNEIWSISLPQPVIVEFIGKFPDSSRVSVFIKWKDKYGEMFELSLKTSDGKFYHKSPSAWHPATTREIRVSVLTTRAPTDQLYQLTVNMYDAAGKPLSTMAVTPDPTQEKQIVKPSPAEMLEGVWDTTIPGSVQVRIEFKKTSTGWTGKFFGWKGWEEMADLKVNEVTGEISWRRPRPWAKPPSDQFYQAKVNARKMTGTFNKETWTGTRK